MGCLICERIEWIRQSANSYFAEEFIYIVLIVLPTY